MVQTKCNGCNHYYKGNCGLSNHFQHNRECKTIHLNLRQQFQVFSNNETKVNTDSKIGVVIEIDKLNTIQSEVDQKNNDSFNNFQETPLEDNSIDTAPFASMETEEDQPIEPINTFMHTNQIRVENNLLKLVSDMNVPNDAFKKIVDWANDAFMTGYQFNPRTTN